MQDQQLPWWARYLMGIGLVVVATRLDDGHTSYVAVFSICGLLCMYEIILVVLCLGAAFWLFSTALAIPGIGMLLLGMWLASSAAKR